MLKIFVLVTIAASVLLLMLNPINAVNAQGNTTGSLLANDTNTTGSLLANDTSLQNKTAVVLETENNETVIIIGESEGNVSTTNTADRVGSIVTNLLNKTGIVISNLPETLESATERGGGVISNASVPAGNIFKNITGKIIGIFE